MHRGVRTLRVASIAAFVALGFGFLAPSGSYAQPPQPSNLRTFDVASDPTFKNYYQAVTRFAAKHRPSAVNHFCILGSSTDDVKNALVLWREGRQIILWEGTSDLDLSRRIIHLGSDVVPTERDLHGSTYLVTQSWVDAVSKNCDRSGVKMRTVGAKDVRKPEAPK